MRIREADSDADRLFLRQCIERLQEHERGYDPRLPASGDMIERYVAVLEQRLQAWGGVVLIAEQDGERLGALTLFVHVPETEPDEPLGSFAYVNDLVVVPEHRSHGAGAALIDAAESLARARGAAVLRLEVMAGNERARRFYERAGFGDRLVQMEKRLD